MCVGKSKRRAQNDYYGDESRKFVRVGNDQMKVLTLVYGLSILMQLDVVLEQPTQSVLPRMHPLNDVLRFAGAIRTSTWLGEFGGTSPKPIQLWHTNGKFKGLRRVRRCRENCGESLVERLPKGRFRGRPKALKSSQVYPPAFCAAVAEAAIG